SAGGPCVTPLMALAEPGSMPPSGSSQRTLSAAARLAAGPGEACCVYGRDARGGGSVGRGGDLLGLVRTSLPARLLTRLASLALAAGVLMASAPGADEQEPAGRASGAPLDPISANGRGRAVERRVDELLAQMSLAEKVQQMYGIGFLDSAWRTPANERLGIPGLAMLDGPRGVSLMAGPATSFPVAMARGATWDPVFEEQVGEAIGA